MVIGNISDQKKDDFNSIIRNEIKPLEKKSGRDFLQRGKPNTPDPEKQAIKNVIDQIWDTYDTAKSNTLNKTKTKNRKGNDKIANRNWNTEMKSKMDHENMKM